MNLKFNLLVIVRNQVVLRSENTLQNKRQIKSIFGKMKYNLKEIEL